MLRRNKSHFLELSLILGAYLVYLLTRGLAFADVEATALANAEKIVFLERGLGIFWELGWQAWTLDNAQPLVVALNWVYIATYWPIIFLLGLLVYLMDRRVYLHYRNVFVVGFASALVIFTLFPLAPPFLASPLNEADRLMNTIQELGPSFYGSPEMAPFYNTNAAMPSLHFTWTMVLGVLLVQRMPGVLKSLGVAYPVLTFFAITITGNHFIVDAVAGGALAVFSLALVGLWTRRRGGSICSAVHGD